MKTVSDNRADLQRARECVAVLERFDRQALTALLSAPADAIVAQLLAAGEIEALPGGFRNMQAADPLADAPARRAELHGLAARHFRARMERGESAAERLYVDHLAQQSELLVRVAPASLAEALAGVPIERLSRPADQHLLRYYQGLAEGLADRLPAACAIFDALLAEPDLDALVRGRALNSGALFAQMQGQHQRALDAYLASRAIWQQLGNRAREANVLHNLGILHYELRALDQAAAHFRQAADIYAATDDQYHLALSSNELGLVYRDEGRWQDAAASLRRAADIFERQGAQHALGIVLGNMGEVDLARGRYDDATELLGRALALMTSRVYAVDYRINLGLIAQAQGDDGAALGLYRAALALADELGRREIVALIRYREGHALRRLGLLADARASFEAAMQAIEEVRTPLRDEGLLIGLMGRWQLVFEAAFQLCIDQGDFDGAFAVSERARARAFADQLARHDAPHPAPVAPLTGRAARALLAPGTLLLSYFATGLSGADARILQALPPQAAGLRECLAIPARLFCLALTSQETNSYDTGLNPNALHSAAGRSDGTRFLAPALLRRLYDALLAPSRALIDRSERVMLIPHGPLHHVPFAALADAQQRALIDRVGEITVGPSATVLLQVLPARRPAAAGACLALGYDGGERGLGHTEAEARAVARLFGSTPWAAGPGTRARFLAEAGSYRYLHLACHGEFEADDPLASWLEVGPGERLTAAEVLAQARLDAALVVLSACRSGVSRVLSGDETIGLARAFLAAGAGAVLVTLWPVEDTSARLLMEHLYGELARGQGRLSPAAALVRAQQFLRRLSRDEAHARLGASRPPETLPAYDDPRFWAAFVMIGAG